MREHRAIEPRARGLLGDQPRFRAQPFVLRFLLAGNPLAYVVQAYRQVLLSYEAPDAADLGILMICAVVTFILGGLFFRHMKRGFADVL